ncbi:F-box protein SKIP16 isoform X1 [Benincasa hispida]|uniref:F-box protein SKIP16 isoform X1 n=1 Tax=Benincasa hispida TaxID=102211 RepID=UPI001901D325|nr:F-box protein SKIP16 isoform X1 [Benincasa hispida]
MELEGVDDLALHLIFAKLSPKDSAVAACVSRQFRSSASEDSLWEKFCNQDLNLTDPIDHLGNLIPSFKETYKVWRRAFGMYPWPLVKRVKGCWDRLKNWLSTNFPEALVTLRDGASEADIQELENTLKVKLPLPTRILYRFHNGQELKGGYVDSIRGFPLGLIGGYTFYGQTVNVYLLPLKQVVSETKSIIRDLGFSRRSKFIVVASSSTLTEKVFFLNCASGQLFVGTANLREDGEMIPCVPGALINSVHECNAEQQQDAMLLWLEEHVRRLENGIIKLRETKNIRSISLFPEESPLCSAAITNGVRVRASAVFIPELTDLLDSGGNYQFAYSIRMSLQDEGCIINGITFNSCQLHLRHWIVLANDYLVSRVDGEAVIGEYPLLHPGEEFVYESCSSLYSSMGSLEGSFTFVPGSLTYPKGSPFEVQVARFPLQVPTYIF